MNPALARSRAFCDSLGLRLPVFLGPMAGACPPALSVAVAEAGGLGSCGALPMTPAQMKEWASAVRAGTDQPFQINLWVPDPAPRRDPAQEARVRHFLSASWSPEVPPEAGDALPHPFEPQCEAILDIAPAAASSVMGLFPESFVAQLKAKKIPWIATVSTVAEARQAAAAGADALIVQGAEAGGHRASFDPAPPRAERELVGLFALLPAVADAVRLPLVAAGGIADGRGIAAALTLGASAVQIGTGFLRSPEAGIISSWADALALTPPEGTVVSRVFSGRAGRSLVTDYVKAAISDLGPTPAPYPVQRALTAAMRKTGEAANDFHRVQAWAGQSAALAQAEPAGQIVRRIWGEAETLLS
ncbi:nitronate monooxygenase [Verrucomicrobium sp. GAS474]|uniref:NAD(P)H-dependent flavin oxidoreductase n=1 Tax=Verrucomicrobium sp. GAS474 TaxID=1882831 RepID=UPI0008792436|nr:nitronate monooxygenase [Verrucomicrobium sp. GAS474]SDU03782.1 nitronate monooxygenase [Verrucomicrobium sp. GAS474]